MNSPLMLVNAGNTRTTTALWDGRRILNVRSHPTDSITAAHAKRQLADAAARGPLRGLSLAAVVPSATAAWLAAGRTAGLSVLHVTGRLDPGVPVDYPRRATLGADRVANVCAATARFGTPVIAIDIGTAVTFDAVTRDRGYIGGVIAPGPDMLLHALAGGTALLPRLPSARGPLATVGRSTAGAMRIGVRRGYAGMVREILSALRETPGLAEAKVCLTGGAAPTVARDLGGNLPYLPRLTLEGLARLFELNPPPETPGREGMSWPRSTRVHRD